MDRLARNLDDLRQLVFNLTKKNITIQFVKENISFSGNDSPMANLLLSVMGAFAEFERAIIHERQKEGIEIAKKKGAFKGRKPLFRTGKKEKFQTSTNRSELARELGISRESLYHYARENFL
jgi:DNA invertase Pin-like site-specific DNA recombinase